MPVVKVWDATTSSWVVAPGSADGVPGAPIDASYIVASADNALNNDRVLTGSTAITVTNSSGSAVLDLANGGVLDAKLGTISSAGKVLNSATTATHLNTASAIVARDGSGNFTAGTVTAVLAGNATTATTLQTARLINGVSFNGSADITVGIKQEPVAAITATSGTIAYDYATSTVFYHTSAPTADWTVNFTSVPTTNGLTTNFTIIVPQTTTGRAISAVQIAGVAATVKWAGSTANPIGNASKTDIWVFTLIRLSSTWTVLGVQSANYG